MCADRGCPALRALGIGPVGTRSSRGSRVHVCRLCGRSCRRPRNADVVPALPASRQVAQGASRCGSPGDRAVIVAPQGLDYIAAFLGALEAGLDRGSPVGATARRPRRADQVGARGFGSVGGARHHGGCQRDATVPARGTRTSRTHRRGHRRPGRSGPIHQLPNVSQDRVSAVHVGVDARACGVVVSHHNLAANFHQTMRPTTANRRRAATGHHDGVVAALFHDMGMFVGVCAPILGGLHAELISPMSFLIRPIAVAADDGRKHQGVHLGAELRLRTRGATRRR